MVKKTLLIITDGIGHNVSSEHNAFSNACKPTYDYLFKNIPYSHIKTSGLAVGLPEGQMGNSEVGHMTMGSGRVLYQNLVKINKALEDGILEKNEELQKFINTTKDIHIMGLMSDGGVHSHINHIIGLSRIASKANKKVYLHLITDGRDVSPTSAGKYLDQLQDLISDKNIEIATISGRFYAMDRDNRWERVEQAYHAIATGDNKMDLAPKEYVQKMYEKKITDEFIVPASFNGYKGFSEDDGLICANFRNDRMREMSQAIGDSNFDGFNKLEQPNVSLITMTEYDASYPYPVMFPSASPQNTLAEVISREGLTQLHTSETEKYAHVTFFFNGGIEKPFVNEKRVLIPSPDVKTYDLKPEMSAPEVGQAVRDGMDTEYDFIVVNFANGDMVGHTGDYEAGIKAVEAVDHELGLILEKAKEKDYALILTSDHGNVEKMEDEEGNVLTNHTLYDVYCFVMDGLVKEVKTGSLSNIAPTVLKLMGLKIPDEMDEPLF